MSIELIELQPHGDERGALIALEENREIPFTVRRVFYIFDTRPGIIRGLHAHRSLTQLMITVRGSCQVKLDDGQEQQLLRLYNPAQGLLVRPMVWGEMSHFSDDCVLMVLADQRYDPADYIHDYDTFRRLTA